MIPTTKPFLHLTADDLMSRSLTMIPQDMSLRAAAHMLAQGRVTGAPVIDSQGRLVGVLSATDFVHWAENEQAAPMRRQLCNECVCSDWQMVDMQLLPADQVSVHMTRDPVTTPPTTGIADLARKMIDAHIHRLIVVDAERRPIGVISSMDILGAVAYTDKVWTAAKEKPEPHNAVLAGGRW